MRRRHPGFHRQPVVAKVRAAVRTWGPTRRGHPSCNSRPCAFRPLPGRSSLLDSTGVGDEIGAEEITQPFTAWAYPSRLSSAELASESVYRSNSSNHGAGYAGH